MLRPFLYFSCSVSFASTCLVFTLNGPQKSHPPLDVRVLKAASVRGVVNYVDTALSNIHIANVLNGCQLFYLNCSTTQDNSFMKFS